MPDLNKPWYKKWWGILVLLFGSLLLIITCAFGFLLLDTIKNIQKNQFLSDNKISGIENQEILKLIEGNNNYSLGSNDPKITIVEFADFGCAFCKNSFPNIREISLKYKNDIKIIFRDYPVVNDYSANLALAARCAGEQGLFWVMHDKLFINQGISSNAEIIELAKQTGADIQRFESCISSKRYLSLIQKDLEDGKSLGVTGTPTWFINGAMVEGDIPYDIFIQIIEGLLNNN